MTSVTKNTKLIVLDPLWNELVTPEQNKLLEAAGFELFVDSKPKSLLKIKGLFGGNEPRVLVVNPDYVNWKLTSEDYENIPHLKGIFIESTGYEWVDKVAANKLAVPISNIKAFSTQAVAEWAIMMMQNVARKTPLLIKANFPLDFNQDFLKFQGIELKGRTAGIIGLGHIGSAIAERCRGLGMNVIYWSRNSMDEAYQKVSLNRLLATADVIFPATAKNTETEALVSPSMMRTMKPHAILIDITHSMFDHKLILEMVANGKLYGYGFEAGPGEFTSYVGNVWAAPSYAWDTDNSFDNCIAKVVSNLLASAKGDYPNRIN
jgi:phosphoglycerate dehydrogenase-like enzyme